MSLATAQQNDHRARPSGVPRRFAIGKHVVVMRKPAPDLALQHRLAVSRCQSLAVDDAHAAQSAPAHLEQKVGERIVRFVGRHAVQIVLGLDDPTSAA